jgi:hypothetical protein
MKRIQTHIQVLDYMETQALGSIHMSLTYARIKSKPWHPPRLYLGNLLFSILRRRESDLFSSGRNLNFSFKHVCWIQNAVAPNSYMGWGIWTPIFPNTWCIWTGITNICREFDLTKTSNSRGYAWGMSRFRLIRALLGNSL